MNDDTRLWRHQLNRWNSNGIFITLKTSSIQISQCFSSIQQPISIKQDEMATDEWNHRFKLRSTESTTKLEIIEQKNWTAVAIGINQVQPSTRHERRLNGDTIQMWINGTNCDVIDIETIDIKRCLSPLTHRSFAMLKTKESISVQPVWS